MVPLSVATAGAVECEIAKPSLGRTFALFSVRARSVPTAAILGIGDSRTAQLGWQFIGSQQFSFVNMGIGGSTVGAYRKFLFTEQINGDLGNPVGAIINLGINDVWTPTESVDWRNFEQDYSDIVGWLSDRGMWVAVCTPVPLEKGFPAMAALERAPRVVEICQRIRSVADTLKLPVIDYNAALRQDDNTAIGGMTLEGIHLTAAAVTTQLELTNKFVSQNF